MNKFLCTSTLVLKSSFVVFFIMEIKLIFLFTLVFMFKFLKQLFVSSSQYLTFVKLIDKNDLRVGISIELSLNTIFNSINIIWLTSCPICKITWCTFLSLKYIVNQFLQFNVPLSLIFSM